MIFTEPTLGQITGENWKGHSEKYQILLARRDFDSKEFQGGCHGGWELVIQGTLCLADVPEISSGGAS